MGNRNKKAHATVKPASLQAHRKDKAEYTRLLEDAHDKKQFTKAAKLALEAFKAFPDNWHFAYVYALSLYNDGVERWDTPRFDALEEIESTCDLIIAAMEGRIENLPVAPPPKDGDPYVLRAFALLGKGERLKDLEKQEEARPSFLDAEEQFLDALRLSPDNLTALTGYAKTLTRLGTGDTAIGETSLLAKECFQKAIALDEAHGPAYVNCSVGYAILLMRNNEDAEALKVFDAALKHRPESSILLYGRDVASGRLNRSAESKRVEFNPLSGSEDKKPDFLRAASDSLAKAQLPSCSSRSVGLPLRL